MRELLLGNAAFRKDYVVRERSFLRDLASAKQSPSTLYVGCSDSRVVPELLTSSAPGELFVVRNVANVIPPFEHRDASVGAAIEYAVGVLHVHHVVVCGHVGCGGVKAILDGLDGVRGLPSLYDWLRGAEVQVLGGRDPDAAPETAWRAGVGHNVLAQLDNLESFPVVADALRRGELQLHGWIYDMEHGHVEVYDAEQATFVRAGNFA